MWLFVLFIAVPLIEIALFITVGGWLTLWPTLGIVLATGILGTALVHRQGRQVLQDLGRSMQAGGNPLPTLAHGGLIVVAGLLLLTPGFFTDTVGLVLMIPAVRSAAIAALAKRIKVQQMTFATMQAQAQQRGSEDVIEGEFVDLEQKSNDKPGTSGWTRH